MAKSIRQAIESFLQINDPDGRRRDFTRLSRAWPQVVGEEIAEMARPVGHKDGVIHLACEESAAMQEVGFMAFYILQQANNFLGYEAFDKLHLTMLNYTTISEQGGKSPVTPDPAPQRPDNLGGLLSILPEDSLVGRAYRACLNYFDSR